MHGRVYVHCTAGLGRAPAVIIAYLFWFTDMGLDEVSCLLPSLGDCRGTCAAMGRLTQEPQHSPLERQSVELTTPSPAVFAYLRSHILTCLVGHRRHTIT